MQGSFAVQPFHSEDKILVLQSWIEYNFTKLKTNKTSLEMQRLHLILNWRNISNA